jgi:3-isopropylmalate/(R)-2-methylmalate dehydratase small subunit
MKAFTKVKSVIAYLSISNIDTDMIIPKQYLKTIKRTGLGQFAFAEMRYDEQGQIKKDFILNQAPFNHAHILMALDNFGCGSSREHAPWSLADFGIQVIIAPSFADIFYGNAIKNGILLINLPETDIKKLADVTTPVTVDLEQMRIYNDDINMPFTIEASKRKILLEGLDDIAETLKYETLITDFERRHS